MATITKPNTFSAGGTILAAEHNDNFDTIYNDYNENITNTNIAGTAAIADTKLAQITTANKVAAGAISSASLTVTDVQLPEQSSAPSTGASEAALYTKDTGGQPELFYREESDGDEVQITSGGGFNSSSLPAGSTVQVVNTQTGAVATGTTVIPDDDTIPQITEGDEYMTLAITPKATTNKLRIDAVASVGRTDGNTVLTGALFQDSTADALAAMQQTQAVGTFPNFIVFSHFMDAGTTSATTFSFRAGGTDGTTTFNGYGGARKLGGVMASSITITEIKA